MMRARLFLVTLGLLSLSAATAACVGGGCPILPTQSTVSVSPETSCLSLHILGSEGTESADCVSGITVVGTNGCTDPLVVTVPAAGDAGSAAPQTFAPGADVSFTVVVENATNDGSHLTWVVPATLGSTSLSITVVGQESG